MSAAASTDVLDTSTVLLKTLSYAVGGMTIECAARSILSASLKLYQGPFPTGSAKPAATCLNLVLILVGSSLSLILSLMTIGTSFISINVCIAMSFSANLSWHLFFVIFAAFLMYKTWHVCNGNSVYTALAVLLFMCRISFGFADLGFSGGIIIEDTCNYKQSEVTGIGYVASDLAIDLLCTAATLTSVQRNRRIPTLTPLLHTLLAENLLRTLFVTTCQAALTAILLARRGDGILLASVVAVYVYTQALGSEFAWRKARKAAIERGKREEEWEAGSEVELGDD